ncbi:DUF4145 domain-containing protein [Pseudomonas coronafaciens]|uniref:DUF4145 domain-containing protein n=1 Tax=Pseudomonas coronafaciens pv. striafaciens TaxID=235276 RepID=A0A3M4YT06_9PSED|nr:DUF4145 domain-containing protein [Pseudomonas coronafaciens]RMR91549.1 hypothetical protein ALP78_05389 [Pseudomonas coronafaciens pv. striafaciens]
MPNKTFKNPCSNCKTKTNHTVYCEHVEEGDPSEYHYISRHQIVKCSGCDKLSFRKIYIDYENAWPTGDDDWETPTDIDIYPPISVAKIEHIFLPTIVGSIYSETCNAYSQDSLTLAGIGLRTTLEAICNDQNIPGKELSTRITNLATKGLISKKDSTRLHAIRFMGNDAAHDIKKPNKKNLDAALIIVEHLLTTVYILDLETSGLDGVIEEYDAFEKILTKKLSSFEVGDTFPISKFFGKDIRKINGSTKKFETELNKKIAKKEFNLLVMGPKAKFQGSKDELQHYTLPTPAPIAKPTTK